MLCFSLCLNDVGQQPYYFYVIKESFGNASVKNQKYYVKKCDLFKNLLYNY